MSAFDLGDKVVLSEMQMMMDKYRAMMVTGNPVEWMTMVSLVQLAVRHPHVTDEQKGAANSICGSIQAMIAEASEPLGLMLESGWHEKYDVTVAQSEFVLGVIALEGDGDAQFDATYSVPADHLDDRWNHEVFVYGLGDTRYVIHGFWSVDSSPLEVYRMCMGLLSQVEPLQASDDLSWMEAYDG